MVQPNPFRTRHSEAAARNLSLYATTFAPEVLHVLPPPPFDQFYVLRSAPGAGKTSLMKALDAGTLQYVHQNRSRAPSLVTFLTDFGVLDIEGPSVLGIIENLDQNYAGLIDIATDPDLQKRLLFKLLDARVVQGVIRAALCFPGGTRRRAPRL